MGDVTRSDQCEEFELDTFVDVLEIENFAGGIVYLVGGKPKVVLFWNIKITDNFEQKKLDKEVKEVNWFPIKQAINNLQYPKEVELLKSNLKGKN